MFIRDKILLFVIMYTMHFYIVNFINVIDINTDIISY